ncbi:MAE_28990/MAE_18760 family HEPN-like nuclease [Paracoccus sp. (in: a-proteobacteria)]|uniref:MAE_28990/MAE_18760 family HEPN-like nuclease n=1 Tax=Paracoccus sp. TaxID=267 RepID=UPI0035B46012
MSLFDDRIGLERVRRVRELSDARSLYISAADAHKQVASHALIVLCYAQWEGYLNYCVRNLIRIVNESKLPAGVLGSVPINIRSKI